MLGHSLDQFWQVRVYREGQQLKELRCDTVPQEPRHGMSAEHPYYERSPEVINMVTKADQPLDLTELILGTREKNNIYIYIYLQHNS